MSYTIIKLLESSVFSQKSEFFITTVVRTLNRTQNSSSHKILHYQLIPSLHSYEYLLTWAIYLQIFETQDATVTKVR